MKNTQEKKYKKIKDPIYGYIVIEIDYVNKIVDTPVFQRLRRIMQTSYTPLYSSALHNRFVHSLGVYHLGTIVSECIGKSLKEMNYIAEEEIDKLSKVYLLACLLHDVGHAPFSHTGEVFYKFYYESKEEKFGAKKLHERLSTLIKSDDFNIPVESKSAAPHEIMSAIIGIKEFSDVIGDAKDCEFFARCITGYRYESNDLIDNIKNCYISMLNSKVIDVDRLDYLIRDSYTSGFETVDIDYERLLNSLTIKEYMDKPCLVYNKGAVSIIENVVYAHDAEKKWIQNHPIVLYEAYIIKHILENLEQKINKGKERLFSEKSLSEQGQNLKDKTKVSLLCDDDIIYLCKNKYSDEISKELFARNIRRHPVWKSEAEYKAYVSDNMSEGDNNLLKECMRSFIECENMEYLVPTVINDNLLLKCEKEYDEANKSFSEITKAKKRRLEVCKYLKAYSSKHNFPFDYLVLPASTFSSNFSKDNLKKTLINFDGKEPLQFQKVCNILNAENDKDNTDMYYLYYRRNESVGKIDDVKSFCEGLINASKLIQKN